VGASEGVADTNGRGEKTVGRLAENCMQSNLCARWWEEGKEREVG